MSLKQIGRYVILATIGCFPSFSYSAQDKILMPVTGLNMKADKTPAAFLNKGVYGIKTGILSTFIDTKSLTTTEGLATICPTNKAGLTDGYQLFTYSLTNDAAASLSFWGKDEIKTSDKVVLYQFAWYKDILNTDGSTDARCGSGVMLALKISDAQANLSLELPMLAATAQLGHSSISYKINTFGLSGKAIDDSIPSAAAIGKFNTESYATLMQSISKIQESYKAPSGELVVTPRLIALSYPALTQGFDTTIAVQGYVLRQIADGKSCREAKSGSPDKDSNIDTVIENTYTAISGKNCGLFGGKPSASTQNKAKALLAQYGLFAK